VDNGSGRGKRIEPRRHEEHKGKRKEEKGKILHPPRFFVLFVVQVCFLRLNDEEKS